VKKRHYGAISILIFLVEIIIFFKFRNHSFVRGFLGDYFIVIFMYTFIQSVFNFNEKYTLIFVFAFSYLVEILQYFKFIYYLGLENNIFANIVLGTNFDKYDLIAYLLGCITVYVFDSNKILSPKKSNPYNKK